MANSAGPDQLASSEANWSGSISWLLQKPIDLDLHCLQKQGISGFSRTRVKVPTKLYPRWSISLLFRKNMFDIAWVMRKPRYHRLLRLDAIPYSIDCPQDVFWVKYIRSFPSEQSRKHVAVSHVFKTKIKRAGAQRFLQYSLDQPALAHILNRNSAVHLKKTWIFDYPKSAKQWLISLRKCAGWSESLLDEHEFLEMLCPSWNNTWKRKYTNFIEQSFTCYSCEIHVQLQMLLSIQNWIYWVMPISNIVQVHISYVSAVWPESSFFIQEWNCLHADNEDSDPHAGLRLLWAYIFSRILPLLRKQTNIYIYIYIYIYDF